MQFHQSYIIKMVYEFYLLEFYHGAVVQWENTCLADKGSRVRIPSAPFLTKRQS